MKFMTIIKGPELDEQPPQALIEAMDAYAKDAKDAGAFVEWVGSTRLPKARVRIRGRGWSSPTAFTETKK
jgi:hypothetical protein